MWRDERDGDGVAGHRFPLRRLAGWKALSATAGRQTVQIFQAGARGRTHHDFSMDVRTVESFTARLASAVDGVFVPKSSVADNARTDTRSSQRRQQLCRPFANRTYSIWAAASLPGAVECTTASPNRAVAERRRLEQRRVQAERRERERSGEPGRAGTVSIAMGGGGSATHEFLAAQFGGRLPRVMSNRLGHVALAQPLHACVPLANANNLHGVIVVVERGGCPYAAKLEHAEAAGAALVVVVAKAPHEPLRPMQPPTVGTAYAAAARIKVPAIMVTFVAGRNLRRAAAALRGHRRSEQPECDSAVDIGDVGTMRMTVYSNLPLAADTDTGAGTGEGTGLEQTVVDGWAQLDRLLNWRSWPSNGRERRRMYFKLARLHHPDKPGGSIERFECLRFAYKEAARMFAAAADA